MKKHDLPAMPFYVGDWMKCPEVRSLTLAQRGLWFDMLCLMWESTERGVLVYPSGVPYSHEDIARISGEISKEVIQMLNQMSAKQVYSIREEDGAIYCRRMVRDEEIRKIRRECGKKGGNPVLLNQSGKPNTQPNGNQITEDEDSFSIAVSSSSSEASKDLPASPEPTAARISPFDKTGKPTPEAKKVWGEQA